MYYRYMQAYINPDSLIIVLGRGAVVVSGVISGVIISMFIIRIIGDTVLVVHVIMTIVFVYNLDVLSVNLQVLVVIIRFIYNTVVASTLIFNHNVVS